MGRGASSRADVSARVGRLHVWLVLLTIVRGSVTGWDASIALWAFHRAAEVCIWSSFFGLSWKSPNNREQMYSFALPRGPEAYI